MNSRGQLLADIRRLRSQVAWMAERFAERDCATAVYCGAQCEAIDAELDDLTNTLAQLRPDDAPPTPRTA